MEELELQTISDFDAAGGKRAMSELARRFLAGTWFALAALVPVAYYFLLNPLNGEGVPVLGGSVILTALVPPSISGICGLLLGADILNPEEIKNALAAIGRGLAVGLLSYLLLFSVAAVVIMLAGENIIEIIIPFIIFFLYGMLLVGWLIAFVGAVAGGLLYLFRRRSLGF